MTPVPEHQPGQQQKLGNQMGSIESSARKGHSSNLPNKNASKRGEGEDGPAGSQNEENRWKTILNKKDKNRVGVGRGSPVGSPPACRCSHMPTVEVDVGDAATILCIVK